MMRSAHPLQRNVGKCVAGLCGWLRLYAGNRVTTQVLLLTFALATLASMTGSWASADDRETCFVLSFAPLKATIPACDRLIDSGDLEDAAMFEALMVRANAYDWAMTYNFGHDVVPDALPQSQFADLDRAVEIGRRLRAEETLTLKLRGALSRRADVHRQLGDSNRAVEDYSEAIDLSETPELMDLLGRSIAFEALGRLDKAIEDIPTILRVHADAGNLANMVVRRAELHEAASQIEAAAADYRRSLSWMPDHGVAAMAIKPLDARE